MLVNIPYMEHMGYENRKQIQIQHEPTHDFIWNIIFMWVALAAMFTYVYHPPVITIFIGGTMWGPQDSVQLVYNYNFTRVYGSYNHS